MARYNGTVYVPNIPSQVCRRSCFDLGDLFVPSSTPPVPLPPPCYQRDIDNFGARVTQLGDEVTELKKRLRNHET